MNSVSRQQFIRALKQEMTYVAPQQSHNGYCMLFKKKSHYKSDDQTIQAISEALTEAINYATQENKNTLNTTSEEFNQHFHAALRAAIWGTDTEKNPNRLRNTFHTPLLNQIKNNLQPTLPRKLRAKKVLPAEQVIDSGPQQNSPIK